METSRYRFTGHALEQMQERGIADFEVILTIEEGVQITVRGNRYGRRRVFTEGYSWLSRDYPHKEVTVVYAVEWDNIIVITTTARYGRWEDA